MTMNILTFNSAILYILIVPVVVLLLLVISVVFAPHRPDSEKVSIYDCGMISFGDTRSQFPIAFYVVAILFLVFDLEIVLLFPLSVCIDNVQYIGFWVAILFILILTIGFVFELGSGALSFTSHRSHE